jgi:hypothetical protein
MHNNGVVSDDMVFITDLIKIDQLVRHAMHSVKCRQKTVWELGKIPSGDWNTNEKLIWNWFLGE